MSARNRIEIMHGVNLNMLGRRDPAHYGTLSFDELQFRIDGFAQELDLVVRFFDTNAEHEFVQHLQPDRMLLMPDGDLDYWRDELIDLVALA